MGVSLLFVDDEELILTALRRALRAEGYTLHFASGAAEALALVARERIDIVVSDYMMPEMSGVELLARLRRAHPHTLRILMTAQADREATIRAINDSGVSGYIEKPWHDSDLKATLAHSAHEAMRRRATGAAPNPRAALSSFHPTITASHR